MNLRYLSMSQLAEVTGVDRRTVKSRLAQVEPYKRDGKAIIYDATQALPYVMGFGEQTATSIDREIKQAELRRELASAEKIEMDNARARGELVSQEDVCRIHGKEITYVRAAILSMPSKLAKPTALEEDPNVTHSLIQQEVDEVLNHIQADTNLEIEPEEVDEKYFAEEIKE